MRLCRLESVTGPSFIEIHVAPQIRFQIQFSPPLGAHNDKKKKMTKKLKNEEKKESGPTKDNTRKSPNPRANFQIQKNYILDARWGDREKERRKEKKNYEKHKV